MNVNNASNVNESASIGPGAQGPQRLPVPPDESIKETIESIVIAFILAFIFRAFIVEAFVIPTGSMAPTLLGAHVKVDCVQCGYGFDFDPSGGTDVNPIQFDAHCPMCHYPNPRIITSRRNAGDRILVQKYIYDMPGFEPRRGDVVVFKAPHAPVENYIKRLVGLPNEAVQIIEGNVYYAPLDEAGRINNDQWRIWRKTDPEENPRAYRIQKAVWQPIYHSQYIPLQKPSGAGSWQWELPWVADDDTQWRGLGVNDTVSRRYDFAGSGEATIHFNFTRALAVESHRDFVLFPYNQAKGRDGTIDFHGLHATERTDEYRIALNVVPQSDSVAIELRTEGRIDASGELQPLMGRLEADGTARFGSGQWGTPSWQEYASVQLKPLRSGKVRHLELWFVDQELSFWVDGELAGAPKRFDPAVEPQSPGVPAVKTRPVLDRLPRIAISVSGGPATLSHIEVDRDLYYSDPRKFYTNGVISKDSEGYKDGEPFILNRDQFYCLGDNSPQSLDSRGWPTQEAQQQLGGGTYDSWEWVQSRKFRDPELARAGIVPRRLMMGRAFFVYFPAMYSMHPYGIRWFPNFGDMRFIH